MTLNTRGHGTSRASQVWRRRLQRAAASLEHWLGGVRFGHFALEVWGAGRAVARGFRGEKISLRASALTYITILSLVPLLAVVFAIVRALGQESLRSTVQEFVFTNLAPGAREQIGTYLDEFIARASAGAMGGLGGFFLLVSAVSLLHNIERSLNEIWGVTRARSVLQRGLIYWSVLTLGPVGLGFSLLASSQARALAEGYFFVPSRLLALIPVSTTVLMLTFLYRVTPNAHVRLRAALAGGLVAGIAWEAAKSGYAIYASKSIRYSAIYGSLGAVPLFLVWVYVSWLVVLFGARLAYALQHAGRAEVPRAGDGRAREVICARVALAACADFLAGRRPPTGTRLARQLHLPRELILDAARALRQAGLLAEARRGGLVPARAPQSISLLEVARCARGVLFDHSTEPPTTEPWVGTLGGLFEEADRAGMRALERSDLGSLAAALNAEVSKKSLKSMA